MTLSNEIHPAIPAIIPVARRPSRGSKTKTVARPVAASARSRQQHEQKQKTTKQVFAPEKAASYEPHTEENNGNNSSSVAKEGELQQDRKIVPQLKEQLQENEQEQTTTQLPSAQGSVTAISTSASKTNNNEPMNHLSIISTTSRVTSARTRVTSQQGVTTVTAPGRTPTPTSSNRIRVLVGESSRLSINALSENHISIDVNAASSSESFTSSHKMTSSTNSTQTADNNSNVETTTTAAHPNSGAIVPADTFPGTNITVPPATPGVATMKDFCSKYKSESKYTTNKRRSAKNNITENSKRTKNIHTAENTTENNNNSNVKSLMLLINKFRFHSKIRPSK